MKQLRAIEVLITRLWMISRENDTMAVDVNSAVPDRKTCIKLMRDYDMAPHIQQHSLVVCRLAVFIAKALNENGGDFSIEQIQSAALLHDITKTRSLETGENHALTGAQVLHTLGYEQIAEIVQDHIAPPNGGDRVTPSEIVSYADKRVLHDKIVGLNERFQYLLERYGKTREAKLRINKAKKRAIDIEQKIMKKVPRYRRELIIR